MSIGTLLAVIFTYAVISMYAMVPVYAVIPVYVILVVTAGRCYLSYALFLEY